MKKLITACFALLAALASCNGPIDAPIDEPTEKPTPDKEENLDPNYTCVLPLAENGKTSWVPGDQILIHGGSADNQKIFTLTADDIIADTLCKVNLEGIAPYKAKGVDVKFFAAYPAEYVKNEGDCKDKNTFIKTDAQLMSGYDSENNTIVFKCIVGGISFIVSGDFDSYELEGNNKEIVGYDKVTCRITNKLTIPSHNDGKGSTKVSGPVTADGVTSNIIYFPYKQPYFIDGYKLYLCKDGKRMKVLDTSGEIDIPRDGFMAVGDITSQLVEFKEPDSSEHDQEVMPDYSHLTHISFTESDALFPNPERGFYSTYSAKGASKSPISASTLKAARLQNRTIYYMAFYPKQFMNGDISEEFLQMVRANMEVLRESGVKCVMRFAYSDGENEKPWDPTPEIALRHIQNIKPILQEYGDVILTFQAGFVGIWGEWYYTENFVFNPSTPEEHYLRKQVVDALLDAMPKDRTVSLRTPMFKRMMYASSYRDTLTLATAYDQSDKARLSGFNDCFGASSNDQGTFENDATREYWKRDSRYTLMGGETCAVSSFCECPVSLKDMEDYHWTYLNLEYNQQVHRVWKNGGCWNEVERRLGYRLSLTDAYHSEFEAGKDFTIALQIKNTGFAAPMNGRGFELVLLDGNGKKTVYAFDDVDPRYWFANRKVNIEKVLSIPDDATGKCTLYLNLPDPKPTLHDNPLFSIRLANENVWEESYGYNKIAEFTL